ncbi:MAG: hypothetical protein JWO32_270 [Bacteroidetes bacterium]|nr:hypothetical protein [Bacteroidota bacterium]
MFKFIAEYYTRSAVHKSNHSRTKQFLNWENIHRIALIIENKQGINKSELDKFIEETKKHVKVFLVDINAGVPSFADWQCFTRKQKTLLGLPTGEVYAQIKNDKYDLVINACRTYKLFGSNLTAQLNAGYKCTCVDLFGEADLVIERKDKTDLLSYLKEVKKYLEMIKTNK